MNGPLLKYAWKLSLSNFDYKTSLETESSKKITYTCYKYIYMYNERI